MRGTEEEMDGRSEGGHAEAGVEEEHTGDWEKWRIRTRCDDPE